MPTLFRFTFHHSCVPLIIVDQITQPQKEIGNGLILMSPKGSVPRTLDLPSVLPPTRGLSGLNLNNDSGGSLHGSNHGNRMCGDAVPFPLKVRSCCFGVPHKRASNGFKGEGRAKKDQACISWFDNFRIDKIRSVAC